MAVKHTPGPWHRHDLHIHSRYESETGVRHYAVADALSHSGLGSGEAEANAALILAAPDLLEALKALVDAIQGGDSEPISEIVAAVSAIAKAEASS